MESHGDYKRGQNESFDILNLLNFFQNSPHGGRDPVEHSTGIMNQLQGVAG
jgi:hypothetical protein